MFRELIDQTSKEKRVLLTRDAKLLRHQYLIKNQTYRVKSLLKNQQLLEVWVQLYSNVKRYPLCAGFCLYWWIISNLTILTYLSVKPPYQVNYCILLSKFWLWFWQWRGWITLNLVQLLLPIQFYSFLMGLDSKDRLQVSWEILEDLATILTIWNSDKFVTYLMIKS